MEIQTTSTALNSSITRTTSNDARTSPDFATSLNNQGKVELSPQARILQQTEQNQQARQQAAPQQESREETEETREIAADFVRVSSSMGNAAQSNNLSSEKATELYRSIEKML